MSNRLNKRIYQLLLSHGFFRFGRAAFDIFLSVLIWRITGDIKTVATFNIIYGLTHTAMFALWAPLLGRGCGNFIKKVGLLGFCIVYAGLAWLGENIVDHVFLLAVIIGIFNGSYWFPYQLQRFDLTHIRNRGNYTGLESAIKILVKLLAPILGGLIIGFGGEGIDGYKWLFTSAAILFILALMFGDSKQDKIYKMESLSWTFSQVIKTPKVIMVFLSGTMSGFGLGNGALSSVLLPLLIFERAGSELGLGSWLSVFALASIVASLIVGKIINYKKYDLILVLGGGLLVVAFILLFTFPSFWSMLLFGAVQQISMIMMAVPRRVYSENLLHKINGYQKNRVGYFVIREVFSIGFGMTASFALLLFLVDVDISSLNWLAGLVVIGTLLQVWLLTSIKYAKEKLKE